MSLDGDHWRDLNAGLTAEEAERVRSAARPVEVRAGQTIYQQGDVAVSMYLVVRGLLKVLSHGDDGEAPSKYLRPGDHFGEASLLVAGPRRLTVQAVTDAVLLEIPRAAFDELVRTIPAFAANLCRSLADWLRREIDGHHLHPYPRVAALLRTTPPTNGLAPQVVAEIVAGSARVLLLTDRPAAWAGVKCDVRAVEPASGGGSLEPILAPVTAALEGGARAFIDLPAEHVPPGLFQHCDEVWLLAESGEGAPGLLADQFLRPAPHLAKRLRVIWLVRIGDRLPPVSPHGLELASRQSRVGVTGTGEGTVVRPGCLARLVHRLQGLHLGLAFGGGGARGAAHIGIMRALERAGLYFDRVAGTSIGSVAAAAYAVGYPASYAARFFLEDMRPPSVFRQLPKGQLWYLWAHYFFGRFETKLRRHLFDYTFDRLLVPLHIVAADLQSGREVVRDEGDVAQAVLESINVPYLSAPIRRDGLVLVDGGILNNVPADVLRARQANFVVASHLLTELSTQLGSHPWQLVFRIMEVQMRRLEAARHSAIDVVVTPKLAAYRFEDFRCAAEMIEAGEEAAEKVVPEIRRKLAELRART
jgi:predicted acylesterase/phospholipase RssA